jgi:UDP-sugar pyrophosphorylase
MEALSVEEVVSLMSTPEYNQSHLFTSESNHSAIVSQLKYFDRNYPGGIKNYISRARHLLVDSATGVNPLEGWTPSAPEGQLVSPELNLEEFLSLEQEGLSELAHSAIVLVAGGLGERLGYSGIKIGLPVELVTETCFIKLFIESILALIERTGVHVPLAIMTSEDTHSRTVDLLSTLGHSDYVSTIALMKQEKVPAIIDNEGRFALEKGELAGKPHGHGDVHILLYQHGIAQRWLNEGKKWVMFIQDTNPFPFKAFASALGVSKRNAFAMNFLGVPRIPKESMGGVARLSKPGENDQIVCVEYNIIDTLMKSSGHNGDISNKELGTGNESTANFSPFPGNINTLLFDLEKYVNALRRSGGAMPEFVNPKYADASKTVFKSATRLECLMQDFSKMFEAGEKVGFTMYDRWISFTAVKNSLPDAVAKVSQGLDPWSAGSGEIDYFLCNIKLLRLAGAVVEDPSESVSFAGISYKVPAKVVLKPSFACSLTELKEKVQGKWEISSRSTLVLEGKDTRVHNLKLDGYAVISSSTQDFVKQDSQVPHYVPVEPADAEFLQIRGFKLAGLN